MKILRMIGIGNKKIIDGDSCISARITNVKKCWWIKVNKKAIRISSNDGAVYPYILTFTYQVDGVVYTGKRYIGPSVICPHINEEILVYYDAADPSRYAVDI
ncbi:MAG: hypothetical protein E7456_04730 [Ruminococcaceae bacterium]|nr:hypothetical protein [Oscillospiraceae bacterium]